MKISCLSVSISLIRWRYREKMFQPKGQSLTPPLNRAQVICTLWCSSRVDFHFDCGKSAPKFVFDPLNRNTFHRQEQCVHAVCQWSSKQSVCRWYVYRHMGSEVSVVKAGFQTAIVGVILPLESALQGQIRWNTNAGVFFLYPCEDTFFTNTSANIYWTCDCVVHVPYCCLDDQ